jgi:hypothetical protein
MLSINQLKLFTFCILVNLLSTFLSGYQAVAATYYVATTGNDSTGDGSIGRPWQTVPKGIRSLHASDTLYIRGGTYVIGTIYGLSSSDTYGCNPNCPTSWESATRIMNYPGEAVTINHVGFNMDATNYPNGLSYLIWKGDARANFIHQLNGTGGDFTGMRVNNHVHHIRMERMTIRNFTQHGIQGGTSTNCTLKPTYVEIIENEIRNNGDEMQEPGPYEHGIYPCCGESWYISRNYVVGNSAFGIHVNNSLVGATNNFTIDRNIVEGRSSTTGGTTAGIVVTSGTGHVIRNNIIIGKGAQRAKLTTGIAVSYRVTGATIVNNTIHDAPSGIQALSVSNVIIRNNLMSAVSKSVDLISGSNVTVSHNLCPVNDPEGGCAVITAAPGFVTPGSNFRLTSGSLAIDAGATVSAVINDHDDAPRPLGMAYDIGAFEGVGSSTAAPQPPRNLSVR